MGEMSFTGLSDADIDAAISGQSSVASGVVTEFVSALQAEVTTTPAVTIGTALGEFVNVGEVAATAGAPTATAGSSLRVKVATAVGAVSLKVLLGTAFAAASFGGAAAAVGLVELPGRPDSDAVEQQIETPALMTTEAPAPALVEVEEVPSVVPSDVPASVDVAIPAETEPIIVDADPDNVGVGTSPLAGCEFGQATARENSVNAPAVDPCDSERTSPTHVAVTPGRDKPPQPKGPENKPEPRRPATP